MCVSLCIRFLCTCSIFRGLSRLSQLPLRAARRRHTSLGGNEGKQIAHPLQQLLVSLVYALRASWIANMEQNCLVPRRNRRKVGDEPCARAGWQYCGAAQYCCSQMRSHKRISLQCSSTTQMQSHPRSLLSMPTSAFKEPLLSRADTKGHRCNQPGPAHTA